MKETKERLIEEFRETFSVPTGKDNWTPDTYPHPLGIVNWLRTALTTLETEVREEERNRIEAIFIKKIPPHGFDLEDGVFLKRLLNEAFPPSAT